jgi:hypothetical protein
MSTNGIPTVEEVCKKNGWNTPPSVPWTEAEINLLITAAVTLDRERQGEMWEEVKCPWDNCVEGRDFTEMIDGHRACPWCLGTGKVFRRKATNGK